MKKKLAAVLLATAVTAAMLAGCGGSAQSSSTAEEKTEEAQETEAPEAEAETPEAEAEAPEAEAPAADTAQAAEAPAAEAATEQAATAATELAAVVASTGATAQETAMTDEEAAAAVAKMIDDIYVQEWTPETEALCAAAREGWDKLTDAQKAMVEGEEASPDYFGADTGDAAADDPRNADEIGENELLVVSFGTSFNESRAQDIGGIEAALQEAYPDWAVRRAFTSQIIANHVLARDGEKIDNMEQALQRAMDNGVKNLIVQPTHLMHGAEYDSLIAALDAVKDNFDSVAVAEPLLGEVGEDTTVVNEDKAAAAEAVVAEAMQTAGYDDAAAAAADGVALVLMGHGTSHTASITYDQMQTQMNELGYTNVFVGTVEGEPEDTACEAVIAKVKEAGFTKVILRPLMVVAGDHANNDMAGDEEDSWKSMFTADGSFESIDCQIAGLGRIPAIQEIYKAHTAAVMQ